MRVAGFEPTQMAWEPKPIVFTGEKSVFLVVFGPCFDKNATLI
jgi:hypothetical protein